MKKKSIWAFALIAMLTSFGRPAVAADAAFDPVEYVNPLGHEFLDPANR